MATSGSEIATADLAPLAAAVARALPPLDEVQRRMGVAVYGLLSEQRQADAAAVAARAGLPVAVADERLAGLPTAVVDDGAVTGFLGLQVAPTTHRIRFPRGVGGTWSAWDALFLPGLLGVPAMVESRCPVTDEPVTVEIDPAAGVVAVSPGSVRLSFLARPAPYAGDIVASFCRWVHFLAGPEAAAAWVADAARDAGEDLVALAPQDGVAIGRRTNGAVFGVAGSFAAAG